MSRLCCANTHNHFKQDQVKRWGCTCSQICICHEWQMQSARGDVQEQDPSTLRKGKRTANVPRG